MPRESAPLVRETRLLVVLVSIVIASYLAAQLVISSLDPRLAPVAVDIIEATVIAGLTTAGLWWGIIRRMREQHRSQDFAQRLQAALQMASTEAAGYDVVRRAVTAVGVTGRAQLMLADTSEAHLKIVVGQADTDDINGCTVSAPFDCPAIRRAQTSRFNSDQALDTCPWLLNRATGSGTVSEVGAVCIPLNVVGRAIGVLHVVGPASRRPADSDVRDLEAIAERAGAQIGMLRVMEKTHLQAATDPLTGLLNRRSLENKLHAMVRDGRPFAAAMGDLDHFKKLNDTHGHDAGDRALRLFARTTRAALRADDLLCRYGGEEFVVVFPGLTSAQAASALERVREALTLAVTTGAVPHLTASFGVADSADAEGIEDLLQLADAALFQAKRQGRNRVVVDRDIQKTELGAATALNPPPEVTESN